MTSSVPGERRHLTLAEMRATASAVAYVPDSGWTFDLSEGGHLTSRRMARSLVKELREKITPNPSRKRLVIPPVPSTSEFTLHKMRINAAKPPKGLDDEQRADWEHRRMADAWTRSRGANRKAKTSAERWKLLADMDGWLRCWVYLCALVYRMKNDRQKAGTAQPDPGTLAAALAIYIRTHMAKFIRQPEDHDARLKGYRDFAFIQENRVEILAERVATAAHGQWNPDWIEQKRDEGRSSSSRGRRPGSGTFASDEARARLRSLLDAEVTHEAIGAEFGVTAKTVQRAVQELKDAAGAPSWWGDWERPGLAPAQRDYGRRISYPGER